jgi:hypothetical protein
LRTIGLLAPIAVSPRGTGFSVFAMPSGIDPYARVGFSSIDSSIR